MQSVMKPYQDELIQENTFIREFSIDTNQDDLVWHRDKSDRRIEVIEGDGWALQYDNHLPMGLEPGDAFNIKANEYHRLYKGITPLKLLIKEKI